MVNCPICSKEIDIDFINKHLDSCTKKKQKEKSASPNDEDDDKIVITGTSSKSSLSSILSGNKKSKEKVSLSSSSKVKSHGTYKYQPGSTLSTPSHNKRTYHELSENDHETIELDGEPNEGTGSSKRPKQEMSLGSSPTRQQDGTQGNGNGLSSAGKARIEEQIKLLKIRSKLPLAERVRPTTLDNYVGQSHLVGKGGILRGFIESDRIPSLILWGYPGTGKTTLARIISHSTHARFVELSATSNGTKDCKAVFEEAKNELRLTKRKTIVFVDEIHRFNKAQQDIFLPYVERDAECLS
ncbi:unnamed protein product [Ambrosiozyma monospora]|uniref:Unnamed protein product n=1 Tax=Ambrosiozyma monospora TaxID=43982 RepID=A0ACB5TWZ6_AMBMO|nr:unnamed protein product [Ambrosiozyma monospora]